MKKNLFLVMVTCLAIGGCARNIRSHKSVVVSVVKQQEEHCVLVENHTPRTIVLREDWEPEWAASLWFRWRVNGKDAEYLRHSSSLLFDRDVMVKLRPGQSMKFGLLHLGSFYASRQRGSETVSDCIIKERGTYTIVPIPNEKWPKDLSYKSIPYEYVFEGLEQ